MSATDQNGHFAEAFKQLREILQQYARDLSCENDAFGDYHLNTLHIMKNKKPLFFGAVHIKKNYVSYHLMPVYVHPELLDDVSPGLRRRMQGKSCFNFKKIDAQLFGELAQLTTAGYEKYKSAGYVSQKPI